MSPPGFGILTTGARSINLRLSAKQLDQFAAYQALLIEWNSRINLTTIVEPKEIEAKHFLDSISCALATGDLTDQHLVDAGAGGGFPGIPLKIVFPGLQLALVESQAKKCRFLEHVVKELALADVVVINDRIEVAGRSREQRQRYDWAVARAVAGLNVLAEYLLPLVRLGGKMLAQKGPGGPEEVPGALSAIEQLGGSPPQLFPVKIPGLEEGRCLILSEKVRITPEKYPRRPGIPTKRPLT